MSHLRSEPPLRALRGRIWRPALDRPGGAWLSDGVLELDQDGIISKIYPAEPGCPVPVTHPGAALLPGFVDTHVHFPQLRVRGSASGPLLDWLEATVFPEEARFADSTYASIVAAEFCRTLLAHGTTAAAIYSSSHPQATEILFAALAVSGLRALAGLTLMDRGAPAENLLAAAPAIDACERLIERWHGHDHGRLAFCVTPRFALSCTPALLRAAGQLADRHQLAIQTHLAENPAELLATAEAFPAARDYLGVYEDHGLCGPRALFAHCIHLSDPAWDRLAAHRAAVAHCPDSNFFLGSGCMKLHAPLRRGIRVGLGSDIGAGRTFSLPHVAARAYDASLLVGTPVPPEHLLWLATRGGALALGLGARVGALEVGYEADLVALALDPALPQPSWLDALLFRADAHQAAATYIRGRRLFASA
ncbi:MAG: guanine deaminase [Nannocystis sp.]|nr:guanine deaminase [Nannocystis sp.]